MIQNLNLVINIHDLFFSNNISSGNVLSDFMLLSSFLSLILGAVVGLSQIRIKRLLAYSTINHVGFLMLALAVFSNSSIESFIFYIVQYTLTNLNIFLIILALSYLINVNINKYLSKIPAASATLNKNFNASFNNHNVTTPLQRCFSSESSQLDVYTKAIQINISDIEYINSLKGLFYKNPILSLSLSICLFSFAGVPPLIGFFAKQQVLYSSNSAGYFFLSLTAIIVSVISAFYYLKIIKIVYSSLASQASPSLTSDSSAPHQEEDSSTAAESKVAKSSEAGDKFNSILGIPSNFNNKNNNNSRFFLSLTGRTGSALEFTKPTRTTLVATEIISPNSLDNYGLLTNSHSFIVGVLTLTIMIFILNPELLLNSIAIITSLILNL